MALNTIINFNEEDNILVFLPEGDMDIHTSPDFKDEVIRFYEQRKTDILIDGEKLEYIDSTGLGALISILKRVKERQDEQKWNINWKVPHKDIEVRNRNFL